MEFRNNHGKIRIKNKDFMESLRLKNGHAAIMKAIYWIKFIKPWKLAHFEKKYMTVEWISNSNLFLFVRGVKNFQI